MTGHRPAGGSPLQIKEGSEATLVADGADVGVVCRLLAFHRQLIVVVRDDGGLPRDTRSLRPGVDAYLVHEGPRGLAALRVAVVKASDERLVLQQLDPFRLGQRRAFTRLEAELPVRLEGLRADSTLAPAVASTTIDYGAGGALVALVPGVGDHRTFRVTLELPGGPPVISPGQLVRRTAGALALRFVGLTALDEGRISQHVLAALAAPRRPQRSLAELTAEALLWEAPQARVDAVVARATPPADV